MSHTIPLPKRRTWGVMAPAALAIAAAALSVLTGCTSPGAHNSANDAQMPAGSSRFVECLKQEGVKAKLNESGQVLVRVQPAGVEGGLTTGEGAGVLMQMSDQEGDWIAPINAAAFANDPDVQHAYETCESKYPDFTQPEFDPNDNPEMRANMQEMEERALAFAECARGEGFPGIADPDNRAPGSVLIPSDTDPDDLRMILDACYGDYPVSFAFFDDIPQELSEVLDELAPIGARVQSGSDQ